MRQPGLRAQMDVVCDTSKLEEMLLESVHMLVLSACAECC